ncbi:MAG TPA: hypothetical protein VME01_05235 [Solirubrobacteraceae bacterium]|nr:hypothetical protein [Solirubrobacteraceae bacterium]
MAQTKRKRQTKHRGNAAGVVQARGRTSRPASPEARKKLSRTQAREERLNRRPTWKSSSRTAALAGVFIFLFMLVTYHPKHGGADRILAALIFAVLAVAIYLPTGFYLETYLWRRRQAKKLQQNR